MRKVRDYSIRAKLTLMIMVTSLGALVIASTVFVFNDRATFREGMASNLTVLAGVLASNSAAAVSFEDQSGANEILGALATDHAVASARIVLPNGTVFAQYERQATYGGNDVIGSLVDGHRFDDKNLYVTKTITAKERPLGALVIKSDLSALDKRLRWFTQVSLMIALIIGGLSLVIVMIFQRMISRPIVHLAEAANAIGVGDVNQKVDYQSADEIGKLYGAFRNLQAYIRELAGVAEKVAANDLTVRVTPKSEKDILSISFQSMVTSLSKMVGQLRSSTSEMVSAASEISASSTQMLKGARDQADQIRGVSTAIEEISSTIMASAENVQEATSASKTASDSAGAGGKLVDDTIKGMAKIESVVRESAQTISKLAQSSQQIGQIVNVINDIADQTNLLALNAAIEAARAGEQGRGFAVVADEVRKLAERTGKATGEIVQMVRAIQDETVEAVEAVKLGIQDVDRGRELANRAGDNLQEIVHVTHQVMGMIQQVALAAKEQSSAAEEISRNINQISTVTRETALGAEQSSAAASQLNHQAETLRKMVEQFTVA
ncbi:MAG: methyl-accepting chemotaxis protein [candidate division Zixibacteria bacterium]|nr:methyl-accepting chemotaxis protein [candidate division Zixibacteria bacterium]